MAHENLKFRVVLDEKNEWQPIFGSQDYGTFYMVYIKIKGQSVKKNETGKKSYKYTCDFKLQNYRGQITMGFKKGYIPELTTPTGHEPDGEGVQMFLNIEIVPFTVNEELNDITLEQTTPLKKGMTVQTNFIQGVPPKDLYDPKNPEKSRYLNPYRFVRDGEAYSEISARKFKKTGTPNTFEDPSRFGCWIGPCIPNRWWIF